MAEAAWYADPYQRHEFRYFNGVEWTEHVANAGVTMRDAIVTYPSKPATASSRDTSLTFFQALRRDPGHATELAALHMQPLLAPHAQEVIQACGTVPAPASREARLESLMRKHRRISWRDGAVTGSSFFVGMPGAMASIFCDQLLMLLQIAALYGNDPFDVNRVAEYLVFQERHPDLPAARASLAQVISTERRRTAGVAGLWAYGTQFLRQVPAMIGIRWGRLRRGTVADKATSILQVVSYVVPLVGIPVWAVANSRASKRLAQRARAFYSSPKSVVGRESGTLHFVPPRSTLRRAAVVMFSLAVALVGVGGLVVTHHYHHPLARFIAVVVAEYLLIATYGQLLWVTRRSRLPADSGITHRRNTGSYEP